MFAIIFTAVAIACCVIAIITDLIMEEYAWAAVMAVLAVLNTGLLVVDINKYQEKKLKGLEGPKIEQVVVTNALRYQVDTITTIHGADTTKTYDLTYWIEK